MELKGIAGPGGLITTLTPKNRARKGLKNRAPLGVIF